MALYNAQSISRHGVGPLLAQPVERQSLAFLTATVVRTDGFDFRIPVVASDPTAAWVNEGQDIPASDPTLAEVTVTPRQVAGLVVVHEPNRFLRADARPYCRDCGDPRGVRVDRGLRCYSWLRPG